MKKNHKSRRMCCDKIQVIFAFEDDARGKLINNVFVFLFSQTLHMIYDRHYLEFSMLLLFDC